MSRRWAITAVFSPAESFLALTAVNRSRQQSSSYLQQLCGHFGMTAMRVLPGVNHESYDKVVNVLSPSRALQHAHHNFSLQTA